MILIWKNISNLSQCLTCTLCGAVIKHTANFRRHMKQHLNPRRFPCQWCTAAFGRKDNLKTHARWVFEPFNTDVRGVSRGPSIGPPWCRETPVSRTAISLIGIYNIYIIYAVSTRNSIGSTPDLWRFVFAAITSSDDRHCYASNMYIWYRTMTMYLI